MGFETDRPINRNRRPARGRRTTTPTRGRGNQGSYPGGRHGTGPRPSRGCNIIGSSCSLTYDTGGGTVDCTPGGGICDCNRNCIPSYFATCDNEMLPQTLCGQSNLSTNCHPFCRGRSVGPTLY